MEDKICQYCVMDTSDPDIRFYGINGCSNCKDARKTLQALSKEQVSLRATLKQVKRAGKGKKYNCVIGVSGGVDSSFVAHMVKKAGLRPIAVHLDNGWDSELAAVNIKNLLGQMGIDLYTYTVEWEEFRDLQMSFLKASTPDSEIPTDHAVMAALYQVAAKYDIEYIITGVNMSSEVILPPKWSHGHSDWKYIKGIQKRFGSKKLKTFPHFGRWQRIYFEKCRKIKRIHILNYISYDKEKAKCFLQKEYNWQDYGGKHYESIYTRFYQAYILPQKFGFDKRKAHLSSLIVSGQMTREEALRELEKPLYLEEDLKKDMAYFLKKMRLTTDEFEQIMSAPKKSYWDYPNYETDWLHRHFGV